MLGLLRLSGQAPDMVFTGEGHAPAPLTGGGAGAIRARGPPEEDCPDWLRPAIAQRAHRARYGAVRRAVRACAGLAARGAHGAARSRRPEALAETGSRRPRRTCDTALRDHRGGRRLRNAPAYADGRVELQDLSAQRAVASVDWPAEGRILDYCAGGGGKALAIADRTGGRGSRP
jgi:16S rRNA (cytosine967-C5)-methyltransferase